MPADESDLAVAAPAEPTAVDLVQRYGERSLSPVDVVEEMLVRIDRRNDRLSAYCLVDAEQARADARASERRWSARRPCGALDGVPMAVKDTFLTRGWPTLRGSRTVDPDARWDDDAPAVAAVRRHGAVLIGKTTTPEFGWKGVTDSPLHGITRNPWDPRRTAGGSSGGSAAALAAGMATLALGTDGGGSIRIPASFCGVVGLKPTFGRVPQWPASPFGVVSHAGPMARSVADAALLLDVLAELDPRDWASQEPPAQRYATRALEGVAGLRVAYAPTLGDVPVDAEVAGLVEDAAVTFAALGAHVSNEAPDVSDARAIFDVLWSTGAALAAAGADEQLVDPGLAALAAVGRGHSAVDFAAALARRDRLGCRLTAFHEDWDLLVTPTLPIAAFDAGVEVPPGSGQRDWPDWTPFTYPFNVTHQPAATVPCGFTRDGLPVGLQIVGARNRDDLVLRAALSFETARTSARGGAGPSTR